MAELADLPGVSIECGDAVWDPLELSQRGQMTLATITPPQTVDKTVGPTCGAHCRTKRRTHPCAPQRNTAGVPRLGLD